MTAAPGDIQDVDRADLAATFGTIGALLRDPEEATTLAGFAARLQARRVRLRYAGMAGAAEDPGLAGRIRGAFGTILAEAASEEAVAGRPCPWSPPSAFEVFFRKQGRITPGVDFPSPWVLAVDRAGADLDVSFTAFGVATEWLPAAAEALAGVIAHGVSWRGRPFGRPADRRVAAAAPRAAVPLRPVSVLLLTPLVTNGGSRADPSTALTGARHRIEGIARWHGLSVSGTDWRAISDAARRADITWEEAVLVSWTRGSRRQDRDIPMCGTRGRFRLSAPPSDLALLLPVLALGEILHLGADVAFGCGRIAVAWEETEPVLAADDEARGLDEG